MTGRQVARLVPDGSQTGVNHALQRLREHGLVDAQRAGRAFLYTLNRAHLAAPGVELLVDVRRELIERIRTTIQGWKVRPAHASLFGSMARGDGDTASDIDLFIVRPANVSEEQPQWRDQLAQLSIDVRRWTGNTLGVSEVSQDDVNRLRRHRPAVVRDLERDAIRISGPAAAELLRRAR